LSNKKYEVRSTKLEVQKILGFNNKPQTEIDESLLPDRSSHSGGSMCKFCTNRFKTRIALIKTDYADLYRLLLTTNYKQQTTNNFLTTSSLH